MRLKRRPWYRPRVPSVLIYENRKESKKIWPFTTEDECRRAILRLFEHLRDIWHCYDDLEMDEDETSQLPLPGIGRKTEEQMQQEWLTDANSGDADAAFHLLSSRRDYEYEEWNIVELESFE